jgi:hypothetical protein
MNHLSPQLQTKLLFESKERFFSSNNNVIKIDNEPYSYYVAKTKMYVFDQNDLFDFLVWYWNNQKESFLVDLSDIDYEKPWKYFSNNNNGFVNLYPDADTFNSNVIENPNMVQIYDNLIAVNGIDDFINQVVLNKYKLMGIKKINNTYYKFATNCGTQIFM